MSTSSKGEPNTRGAELAGPGPSARADRVAPTPSARRSLHPALDFDRETGRVAVGVPTHHGQYQLLIREGNAPPMPVDAKKLHEQGGLYPAPRQERQLAGQWEAGDLQAFLADSTAPTFAELLGAIKAVLLEHVEFVNPEDADVVACWIAGTYFYPLFEAFPRLYLHGGKGSGKSKVLQLIAEMAHNGLLFVIPTVAIIYRLVEPFRPTLCLDEMEGLDRRGGSPFELLLNTGYKAGAAVPRVEGDKTYAVVMFDAYAPVALAGIAGLNEVTADRTITITMRRGTSKAKSNRSVAHDAPEFRAIRAMGYRLAVMDWRDVYGALAAVRRVQDRFTRLQGRPLELYRPLIALGLLASVEGDRSFVSALGRFVAREQARQDPLSTEEAVLFSELERRLTGVDSVTVYGAELVAALNASEPAAAGGRAVWTPRAAAGLLRRFFEPGVKTNRGIPFHVTRAVFEAAATSAGYVLARPAGGDEVMSE